MHSCKCKKKREVLTFKLTKMELTRREAERKLGLKVAGITVKVFIRNHHHHPLTPAQITSC